MRACRDSRCRFVNDGENAQHRAAHHEAGADLAEPFHDDFSLGRPVRGRIMRLGPVSRISMGLISLAAFLLLVADLIFGLLPDEADVAKHVRKRTSESAGGADDGAGADRAVGSAAANHARGDLARSGGAVDRGPAQATARWWPRPVTTPRTGFRRPTTSRRSPACSCPSTPARRRGGDSRWPTGPPRRRRCWGG